MIVTLLKRLERAFWPFVFSMTLFFVGCRYGYLGLNFPRDYHDGARQLAVGEGVISGALWFIASFVPLGFDIRDTWSDRSAALNAIAAAATAGAAMASVG